MKGLRAATPDEPAEAHFGLVVKPIPKPLNTALRAVEPMHIVRAIRPTVGRDVSLWMFRNGYYMGLIQSLGKEYVPWSMLAGRKMGRLFEKVTTYEQMRQLFESMKLGRLKIDVSPVEGSASLTECALCCGLMGFDEPVCSFQAGLIGALVHRISGKECVVRETRCMALYHEACEFEIEFAKSSVE